MDVSVVDVPEKKQFEGRTADGTVAGLAAYDLIEGAIVFTHTEVSAQFEGQGVAGKIVRAALDAARQRGLRVVALCPYVRAFLRKNHEEYADLVGQPPPTSGAHPTGVHRVGHEVGSHAGPADPGTRDAGEAQ